MSELIATTAQEIVRTEKDCDYMDELFGGVKMPPTQVYLKSEVDKVLAEKDTEIAKLKVHRFVGADEVRPVATIGNDFYLKSEADKVIAHHKYKRCLLIAKWCFEKSYSTTLVKYDKESGLLRNFYDWWGKRWLELAEEPTWERFLQLIHKEAK